MVTPAETEEYLARHERKELLRFVAVGSVDDGKSTLIGRLLHDTHGIYEDQMSDVVAASKRKGSAGGKVDFALLTDGLKAEREQGITIDVAYRYFSTDKRKFIIADTPGHVQYTRNMATGASTADVALILIDARSGVMQQSRRHAYIASLLGIPQLAVCVNKMDLCGFDEQVYDAIVADFSAFAAGLSFHDVRYIPVCAVDGDNVVHPSERMPWYSHATLLELLETVPVAGDRDREDFRYPVQLVLRPHLSYRGFCGQIASGVIQRGDAVTVLPSGKVTRVAAIDTYEGEIELAFAPMSVTLRLADEIDASRGDMMVHAGREPMSARRFEADVVWMSETPLDPGRSYFLKQTTRMVRANIDAVEGKLDLETLGQVATDTLRLNDIGRLRIASNQPLYFDSYDQNRQTGAFILVDAVTNNTVAAGMIRAGLEDQQGSRSRRRRGSIEAEERSTRLGHRAALLWFDGEPEHGQSRLAYGLERELFDAGCMVTVIDVAAFADGTRSHALFADLAEQSVRAGALAILSSGLPRAGDRAEVIARFADDELVPLGGDPAPRRILGLLRDRGILKP